ncbi:MAG: energy-coupling factor transporter transmembrane protein EcfT [Slackia piriformis]|uniref:Energy-coupling factor transporter transmembrane protein EcfT n=1 Tax=Slackia piriformis TaxID=626934 RepID=A0A943UZU0_9ACTN|nr:energy-coupling factor transporter transmembrane protein EcfT [Slackia piriformis]
MNTSFSFGSYYPGSSVLHRLDPRTKLLAGAGVIAAALVAPDFAGLAVVACFVACFYALSRIPLASALRSLAPLLAIVVLASAFNLFLVQGGAVLVQWWFIRISEAGVHACAFIACRLLLMMAGMSLVTMTTATLDLTEGFERLLSPFARIGLPAHELGMILGIALRFMPQFADELVGIYRAQISRGARLSSSPTRGVRMLSSLAVPLFSSALRRAETLAAAMDARCYHGSDRRTRLHPLVFAARDGAAAAVVIAMIALSAATSLLP